MSKSTLLPINAVYLTWLRDYGKYGRPKSRRESLNKRTGEVKFIIKTKMDMIDYSIYMNLLTRADKDNFTCFPSINLICEDCFDIDRRTVANHLSDLEQMGFIEIRKQKGKSHTYYMKDFAEWLKNPRHKD